MTEGHEKKADLKDLRKEDFKLATSVFLSTILAAVLNFIIYMSFTMIFLGLSTKTIGERIYEREKDGSTKLITEIYYDATTTAARTETTAAGTSFQTQKPTETAAGGTESSVTGTAASSTSKTSTADTKPTLAENQFVESIRTEMPKTASVAMDILSQSFMFVLFATLIYSKLWERGDRDANSVNFGRMEEDKLRGLRIGLIAAVPSIVFYLLLVVSKLGLITEKYFFIYRFLNLTFMPVMSALTGKAGLVSSTNVSWLSLAAILLTVATLPLISHAAYLLGYNHISLSEKIIYVNPDKKRKRKRY